MKLMFVTLGGQEVIDDAYLERGDFWPKILEYGNAIAEAAVNDAIGGDEPVAYLWHENGRPVAASIVPTTRPDRMCLPLYTRPQASAAVPNAAGAGFPELCELMRGLEIPPSALSLGPRGLYLIGKAIADQAKEANEEL